ncbi:MAG: hypothetical protein M3Q08_08020 [Pseudomonadota bacterium]|nr:hypothetical protein [Pseudomonadota bacterium]
MTLREVEALFHDYAAAFSSGDVDRVCSHWNYPAFFAARAKRAALSEDEFRKNTAALSDFYRNQGVVSATKAVLRVDEQFTGLAFVRTADKLTDSNGEIVAEWEHGYLVSETSEGLRVVAAMPDEELDAWQRRGTPLGSW